LKDGQNSKISDF